MLGTSSDWIATNKAVNVDSVRTKRPLSVVEADSSDNELPTKRLRRLRPETSSPAAEPEVSEGQSEKGVSKGSKSGSRATSVVADDDDQDSSDRSGESDYLEFRRVTENIKSLLVDALGGTDESNRKGIASQIQRGRCSFMRSYSPPEAIVHDNPTLKPYQVAAVHWMLTLYENELNGLVADDMGLGKTAESICFLKRLIADKRLDYPVVVACPTTLLDNWCAEFQKWAPRIKVLKYHGSQNERRALWVKFATGYYNEEMESEEESEGVSDADTSEEPSKTTANEVNVPVTDDTTEGEDPSYELPRKGNCAYHVIVTTHQTLANPFDRQFFFKARSFSYLVVDEAHSLKNSASQRYKKMNKSLNAVNRLLLTGSPVQNQISELKNLLYFLNPYRKATFDINAALGYHNRVWKRAVQEGDEVEAQRASIEGGKDDQDDRSTAASPEPERAKPSGLGKKSATTDPEIVFYQQLLAPLILRRLKVEVIDNFPKKTNKIELCDMEPVQLEMYRAELLAAKPALQNVTPSGRRRRPVKSKKDDESSPGTEAAAPSAPAFIKGLLFRLRRICNHPLLHVRHFGGARRKEFAEYLRAHRDDYRNHPLERVLDHISDWSDFDVHTESGNFLPQMAKFRVADSEFLQACKIRRMLELVDQVCIAQQEKVLVFSQFTTFLDVIQETLRIHRPELPILRLDGSTAVDERSSMVSAFQEQDSSYKVFLLSTRAGGVGLNLTRARTVLLMDQDWNPHNDRQAEDRVHRLGQTDDVTVYRLCCRHSFEETILSCCKKKLELDEAFGGNVEALPLEIFEDLIRTVKTTADQPSGTDTATTTKSEDTINPHPSESGEGEPSPGKSEDPLPREKVSAASRRGKRVGEGTTNARERRRPANSKSTTGANAKNSRSRTRGGVKESTTAESESGRKKGSAAGKENGSEPTEAKKAEQQSEQTLLLPGGDSSESEKENHR